MENKNLEDLVISIVDKNIGKIWSCIYTLGKNAVCISKLNCGAAFVDYLDNAMNKYSKCKTILYKNFPVYLYDYFIDIDLKNDKEYVQTDNINKIINISNTIIITGSGGVGKSTLLKHLFLNTIKNTERIPIFIELRELNNTEDLLIHHMYKTMSNLHFHLEEKFFTKALESGCFTILMDGFDEVKENRKIELVNEIMEITDKYNENIFIISSRQNETDDGFIGWSRFTELKMMPLDKKKAIRLTKKLEYDKEIKDIFIHQLEDNLYDKYESFTSNPLLLTIMLMTFDQYAAVPEKIYLFYGQAFDTLYSRHDANKSGYIRQMKCDLAADDFKRVLEAFCAISYLDNKTTFYYEELKIYLEQTKELVDIEFNLEDYFKDLCNSVCMIMYEGIKYKYTHRSFQEYFTARYISTLNYEEQHEILFTIADNNAGSIRNDSVISILFEINKEALENNFIIPILKEIKAAAESSDIKESYIKYLRYRFDGLRISIDNDKKDDNNIIFGYVAGERKRRNNELSGFVIDRYMKLTSRKVKYYDEAGIKDIVKYCYEMDGDYYFDFEDIDDQIDNSELFDTILSYTADINLQYNGLIRVLENLVEKHKKTRDVKLSLLKLRHS